MALRRSLAAVCPLAAILGFVACDAPDGDGALARVDSFTAPSATPTLNPDGTSTKHLCKVAATGDGSKVISGTLLLPEGPAAGELFIDRSGVIACAGASCSSTAGYAAATKIACTDVVISPGLINAHDHISFANNPPGRATDERYEHRHDWRKGLRGHTVIKTNAPTVRNAVAAAELRFLMSGLTSTASGGSAGSGAPGLARNLDSNVKQLEGLPIKLAVSDTFPLGDSNGTLATTCDRFSSNRKKASDIASMNAYLPHVAEGVDDDAHAEFLCQSNTFPSASDPAHDLIQRQTAVIHGVAVNPGDIQQYRKDLSILIWSPRSNVSLYGNTAPIAEYAHLGVPIALGTDWLPSGSMNVARELKCADDLNRKYFDSALTDRQLWQSVTVNAAYATGTAETIGQLKAGMVADIAIFDASQTHDYRAVIEAGVEDTVLVLRGGKTMYGDSELLSEIGDGDCESLPVCKFTKMACVKKDTASGVTLADLQTAAGAVYPLFYCKGETPRNEPSCEPSRGATASDDQASVYDGITADDKDGDGVENATDNCPTVFNPIRPMDHGAQGDADGDGVGDACDRCPLTAGESCTPPDADDMDGDGVPNFADKCPEDADPGCGGGGGPPTPTPTPATLSITDIRDPASPNHPVAGASRPALRGVVVTAVKGTGFFVQDPTKTELGGLFVFTGASKAVVTVGNTVDVEGDYVEFDGASELANPKVTVVDAGTALSIAPIPVPADYNADGGEKLEGMLCVVNGPVAVTVANADAPLDFDELVVTGGVRLDDFLWPDLDNTYAVGTPFAKVVGICHWSHGNRKIYPRSAADL